MAPRKCAAALRTACGLASCRQDCTIKPCPSPCANSQPRCARSPTEPSWPGPGSWLRTCPSPRLRTTSSAACWPAMQAWCRTRRRASCACTCCTKHKPAVRTEKLNRHPTPRYSPALVALSEHARTPKAGHWKSAHFRNSVAGCSASQPCPSAVLAERVSNLAVKSHGWADALRPSSGRSVPRAATDLLSATDPGAVRCPFPLMPRR